MPYFLDGKCVKKGTKESPGETVKCHETREDAVDHLRALMKNVPDAHSTIEEMEAALSEMEDDGVVRGSRIRLYFQEGEQTVDLHVIDINATNFNRPPPYSLTLQTIRSEGHQGAAVCGVIEKVMRDGPTIVAEGRLDMNGAAGREAERLIREGILQTWSPDLADCTVDIEENITDEDTSDPTNQLAHFVKATFNGGTLVPMPALASAVVELLDDEGNVLVAAPKREHVVDEAEEPEVEEQTQKVERLHAGGFISVPNGSHIVGEIGPENYVTSTAGTVMTIPSNEAANTTLSPISACAAPSQPPPEFFTKPELSELQRWVTVTADGRVYGHAAGFGECHIGYLDQCVTIEHIADCRGDGNFEYATPGHVICSDGSKVATGPITIKGGHAPKGSSYQQALSHYDDPTAAVADVCYFMDEHGVSFSGALRSSATEAQVQALRASGVSLDARQIGGKLRYLATCAVNTPGFPKVRLTASGDEVEVIELIAAGGAPQPAPDMDCGCGELEEFIDEGTFGKKLDLTLEILKASGITQQAIDNLESQLPATKE